MFDADRQTDTMRMLRKQGTPAFLDRRVVQAGARPRTGFITALALLIVLAVAAIGLSPTTAQLCGKLDDFPCGP